jgi:hypothetical protein
MAPRPLRKVLVFMLFLSLGGLFGLGRSEDPPRGGPSPPAEGSDGELNLEGRVRLVGSSLFSRLVLTDGEGRDWYLEGADRKLLARFEQRRVRVRGRGEYRELILANGRGIGVELFLREVSLLEPPAPEGAF